MYYAIHHVSRQEDDDYMDLEMLEELAVSYDLHYFLMDEEAGEAREMDIKGNCLRTMTEQQSKNTEWALTARILSKMQAGDTLIAGQPSQISQDRKIQASVYQVCLNRKIRLVFLKTPYLNSDNFTGQITNTNRKAVEAIIQNLLSAPIVCDSKSQEELLKTYRHQDNQNYEVKKTS